jgi:hypothetical protein
MPVATHPQQSRVLTLRSSHILEPERSERHSDGDDHRRGAQHPARRAPGLPERRIHATPSTSSTTWLPVHACSTLTPATTAQGIQTFPSAVAIWHARPSSVMPVRRPCRRLTAAATIMSSPQATGAAERLASLPRASRIAPSAQNSAPQMSSPESCQRAGRTSRGVIAGRRRAPNPIFAVVWMIDMASKLRPARPPSQDPQGWSRPPLIWR